MSVIGNIFLALNSLIFIGLFNLLYLQRIPRAGDAVVGYAWTVIFLSLAFAATALIVTAIIGGKGGFGWTGQTGSSRFWMTAIGFLITVVGFGFSTLTKNETGGVTPILHHLTAFTSVLIPVLFIAGSAILLNDGLRNSLAPIVPRASVLGAAGLAGIVLLFTVQSSLAQSRRNAIATAEYAETSHNNQVENMLNTIRETDVNTAMGSLLVYTDRNQEEIVRSSALAKIKSRTDWEHGMAELMETDWASEVFTFLASNDVPDPAVFHEAIGRGILKQGELIRQSIRKAWHPSNFYEGQFYYDTERVLATVDRYRQHPQDYLPELESMRLAFDEPSEFEKPKFRCLELLDKYIRKAKK